MAIPVNEMPALGTYSASGTTRPVVSIQQARYRQGQWKGDWPDEVVSSETSEKWSGTSRNSRVPAEYKLESIGERRV